MANPASPANAGGQALDYLITDAGVAKLKRGKGAYAPSGATTGSADTTVQGAGATGAAVAGDPVLVGGSDGTNARTLATDTTGRAVSVGAGVAGTPAGGVLSVQGVTTGTPMPVTLATNEGTDVTASATGAAAAITATLAAAAAKTTYITGFEVTGSGATLGSAIVVTVTGTLGGTLSYVFAVPAGILLGATPLIIEFTRPIPGSAVNTAIVVNVPSLGAGNTNSAATAHGFQL